MARAGQVVPPWYLAELFGLHSDKESEFAGQLLAALEKISPDLTPRLLNHPLIMEITRGPSAFPGLLTRLEQAIDDQERGVLLDAIAEILTHAPATHEVVQAIERELTQAKDPVVGSIAARALATARHEPFLEHQRNLLASKRPDEVRVAAKLLGYGRHRRAVPALLELLRPETFVAADAIVWALGELGDAEAVPLLHHQLSRGLLVEHALSALGKLGSRASVVRIVPFILEGSREQREKAAEAIARIIRKNDGSLGDPGLDDTVKKTLDKVLDTDASRVVRFYAILGVSLLGGRVEPPRMLAALGGQLSKKELDAVGGLLVGRAASGPKPTTPTAQGPRPKKGRKPL
jgi:HEAT repeat protein